MGQAIGNVLRAELEACERELGRLPLPVDEIIRWEMLGFCVNLVTGEVTPDSDRVSLTLVGEAVAVVAATGFCEGGGASWS